MLAAGEEPEVVAAGFGRTPEAGQGVQEWAKRWPCFFFSSRRRHTRLLGDWSSDVCSSDLAAPRTSPRRCRRTAASIPRWPMHSPRSEEHTSELQSPCNLVCRLLLEKKK